MDLAGAAGAVSAHRGPFPPAPSARLSLHLGPPPPGPFPPFAAPQLLRNPFPAAVLSGPSPGPRSCAFPKPRRTLEDEAME